MIERDVLFGAKIEAEEIGILDRLDVTLGLRSGDRKTDGVETVKLFVTEQAAAFTTRLRDDDEEPAEDEDWTTVSVPFALFGAPTISVSPESATEKPN